VSQISTGYPELVEVLSDRTALFRCRLEVPVPSLEPARNGPMSPPSRCAAAVPSR